MKTNIFKCICLTTMLTVATITNTGCTDQIFPPTPEPEKTNISVIISPTANEPPPNISLAQDIIYDASYSYAFRNIVVDDGNPFEAVNGNLTHTDHNEKLSDANKKSDAQVYTNKFIESADEVTAVTAEKDTAKAIRTAADSLSGLDGKKTIVLIDNGISTTGSVAFKTFKGFDVKTSLNDLHDYDLPDLKDINIIWYDFGATFQPQQSLSMADLSLLQEFWTGYLIKAGAKEEDITIKNAINTNAEINMRNLPAVSTVEVSLNTGCINVTDVEDINKAVANVTDEEKNNIVNNVLDNSGIKIDETIIKFKPESAEISDKESAMNVLKPTADSLINSSQKIVILGTTATVLSSKDKCVGFSLERANAVRNLLIEMGVDENQIISKGLGFENEFHVGDLKEDGISFNEHAPENRAVFIYATNSETGKKYIT
ncbi:MAG: OmpA family protein [Ruminococcus sp.]|nr:OmpA family protein [Ruminococcus sp.]